jgi:hypothetical protein
MNSKKAQQQEWRNPETRAILDKLMPNASDNEKFERVKEFSEPKAEEMSRAQFMEMRKKHKVDTFTKDVYENALKDYYAKQQYQPSQKEVQLQQSGLPVRPDMNPELTPEQFYKQEQQKALNDKLWRVAPYLHYDGPKVMEMEPDVVFGNAPEGTPANSVTGVAPASTKRVVYGRRRSKKACSKDQSPIQERPE